MKKLLTATLAIAMGATLVGALAACKNGDADTAKKAIQNVRTMYADKAVETPDNYTVIGQTKVGDDVYASDWTVTSTFENFANYVSVGEMDATSKLVTVSVTKAEAAIDYKLIASVTVGSATETEEFTRKVPASQASADQVEVSLSFADKANRTSQTAEQQIWQQNGVKFTNDKASSSTDVADYVNPVRIYQGSTVKIEYPGMKKLIFHSIAKAGSDDYPTLLLNSINAANLGAEATLEGNDVTLNLPYATDVLEFSAVTKLRLNSIDVVANKDGTTDADKVAGAKATLDIANKNIVLAGEYDLVAEKNGATVTWAVKGESANVSIKSGKLSVESMPATETEVTLTATIASGEVTDTKDITIKLVPIEGLVNDGTEAHPYTTVEAKKVAKLLAEGTTGTTLVYVTGYVIAPGTYSEQFKNFDDMYIAETYAPDKTTTAEDALYVYRPKPDGTYLTTAGFNKGDLVTFKGYLQNYKADTQELVNGTCVAVTPVERTEEQVIADAKAEVKLSKTTFKTANEEVPLPSTHRDANLVWSVKETTDLVEITDSKLVIKSIPETETKVTLTVTISYGSATPDTKDIEITIRKPAPAPVGTFKFALVQKNLDNKKLYFAGTLSGNYGATTESPLEAADVVVAEATGGYTFKVGAKYLELAANGNNAKLALVDTTTAVWTWDVELEVFTFTVSGTAYYLGTYSTFNTISASKTSYISGDNAANVGVTQFVAGFETFDYDALTATEKVALVKNALTLGKNSFNAAGDENLPAVNAADVTVTWTSSNTELVTIASDNTKLTVVKLPEADTEVTLTATIACGSEATDTKTFAITVKAPLDNTNSNVLNFAKVEKGNELTTTTALSLLQTSGGANLTSVTTCSKVYAGNSTGGPGAVGGLIKFGTSSANGELTLVFDKKVTKIVINCGGWGTADTIAVNDGTAETMVKYDAHKDYEFDLTTASETIKIVTAKRALIYSITVYFEGAAD